VFRLFYYCAIGHSALLLNLTLNDTAHYLIPFLPTRLQWWLLELFSFYPREPTSLLTNSLPLAFMKQSSRCRMHVQTRPHAGAITCLLICGVSCLPPSPSPSQSSKPLVFRSSRMENQNSKASSSLQSCANVMRDAERWLPIVANPAGHTVYAD
jgi:hypothetical protein